MLTHANGLIADTRFDPVPIDAVDSSKGVGCSAIQRVIQRVERTVVISAQVLTIHDAIHKLARHRVDVDEQRAMDGLRERGVGSPRLSYACRVSFKRLGDDMSVGQIAGYSPLWLLPPSNRQLPALSLHAGLR